MDVTDIIAHFEVNPVNAVIGIRAPVSLEGDKIVLRFSNRPWEGCDFGRRSDVSFHKEYTGAEVSTRHFGIRFNFNLSQLVFINHSKLIGTYVVRPSGQSTEYTSFELAEGDVIRMGNVSLKLVIPLSPLESKEQWAKFKKFAQAQHPNVERLLLAELRGDTVAPSTLSYLRDEDGDVRVERGAPLVEDNQGKVYVLKTFRERLAEITRAFHPHIIRNLVDKPLPSNGFDFAYLKHVLPCEWYLSLAEAEDISPREMLQIVCQIFSAVDFLHNVHELAHRSIEPFNIKIVSRDLDSLDCKLSFGHGGRFFRAPEVTDEEPGGYPSDIWAIGTTLLPFSLYGSWKHRASETAQLDGKVWREQVSRPKWQPLTDFANHLLRFNPYERPLAKTCLSNLDKIKIPETEDSQLAVNLAFLREKNKILPNWYQISSTGRILADTATTCEDYGLKSSVQILDSEVVIQHLGSVRGAYLRVAEIEGHVKEIRTVHLGIYNHSVFLL